MGKFTEGLLNDDIILENLNICPGQTILDAGCGNGYMAKKFSKLVGRTGKIYALDSDKSSIHNLKKEVEKRSNIEVLVGDITKKTIRRYDHFSVGEFWKFRYYSFGFRKVLKSSQDFFSPTPKINSC